MLLVLAGALNLRALSTNGWATECSSGAVRSMAASWHAFLYGSLGAAGVMTVDKPDANARRAHDLTRRTIFEVPHQGVA